MVTSGWNTSTSLLHLEEQISARTAVTQMWLAALSTLISSVVRMFKNHHQVLNFHHRVLNLLHRMLKLDRSSLFYNLTKPFLVFKRKTWTHRSNFVIFKPTIKRYTNNNNNYKGKFIRILQLILWRLLLFKFIFLIHFNTLTNYFIHFNSPTFKLYPFYALQQ